MSMMIVLLAGAATGGVASFGYYWALQDGSSDAGAVNPRNCTAGPCSWDHANAAFVQNSWKHPAGADATEWDVSDVLQLARHSVRGVVSVSHVFTTGPAGGLHPDFVDRWAAYAVALAGAGALPGVLAFYPSDEPDLRMPAATLNAITRTIKTPLPGAAAAAAAVPVLVTLSNLAVNASASPGAIEYALDPAFIDVLTFDIYWAPTTPWPVMRAKLDVLAAWGEAHNVSTAAIPDATAGSYAALGGAANVVLNDAFVKYCHGAPRCVALLPFAGGHWAVLPAKQPEVYGALARVADAARTGDWRGTAVDPGLICPRGGELFQLPCIAGGCNAALSDVFGSRSGSAAEGVLPSRQVTMALGSVWLYQGACLEIVSTWGAAAGCSGESVACWQAVVHTSKARVVACTATNYVDLCDAEDADTGETNANWTCCLQSSKPKATSV
jgi:hypothetical protein